MLLWTWLKNLLPVTLVISKEFMQFRRKLKHVAKLHFWAIFGAKIYLCYFVCLFHLWQCPHSPSVASRPNHRITTGCASLILRRASNINMNDQKSDNPWSFEQNPHRLCLCTTACWLQRRIALIKAPWIIFGSLKADGSTGLYCWPPHRTRGCSDKQGWHTVHYWLRRSIAFWKVQKVGEKNTFFSSLFPSWVVWQMLQCNFPVHAIKGETKKNESRI